MNEPQKCTCTQMAVPTLAETLRCPLAWVELPSGWWRHVQPRRSRSIKTHGAN